MGARRRLIAVALVGTACFGGLGGLAGCKRKEQAPAPPAPSVQPSADRLAPGEIPEGRERAFTLPLPLHSTVSARFPRTVHVASSHTQEEVAAFVRKRVKDGTTSTGRNEIRFDRVVVAADPSKTLSIQVRPEIGVGEFRSQIVVEDITVPPEEPGLTTEDRYRKAGLGSDGKLLDRNHLQ